MSGLESSTCHSKLTPQTLFLGDLVCASMVHAMGTEQWVRDEVPLLFQGSANRKHGPPPRPPPLATENSEGSAGHFRIREKKVLSKKQRQRPLREKEGLRETERRGAERARARVG